MHILSSRMQKVIRAQFSYWVDSWFQCGGGLVTRWGQLWETMGLVVGENWEHFGRLLGMCLGAICNGKSGRSGTNFGS